MPAFFVFRLLRQEKKSRLVSRLFNISLKLTLNPLNWNGKTVCFSLSLSLKCITCILVHYLQTTTAATSSVRVCLYCSMSWTDVLMLSPIPKCVLLGHFYLYHFCSAFNINNSKHKTKNKLLRHRSFYEWTKNRFAFFFLSVLMFIFFFR